MQKVKCPFGDHMIDENSKICPICGNLLSDNWSRTRVIAVGDDEASTPRFGTSFFNTKMMLHLRVRGTDKAFTIAADTLSEVVVGRADPDKPESSFVDLSPYNALDKGVSRRHAKLIRREANTLHVCDLGSANGTFLNGQQLIPQQERIIRNGDELRLGTLVLLVEFTRRSLALK